MGWGRGDFVELAFNSPNRYGFSDLHSSMLPLTRNSLLVGCDGVMMSVWKVLLCVSLCCVTCSVLLSWVPAVTQAAPSPRGGPRLQSPSPYKRLEERDFVPFQLQARSVFWPVPVTQQPLTICLKLEKQKIAENLCCFMVLMGKRPLFLI